ncbi:MAG: sugar ABC transporter permease, partial [Oscillospiraceae bacterium]
IDPSIFESAEIDGCSKPKQFFFMTLPLLKNTMTILIVTKIIDYMQVYTPIKFITEGGPGTATQTMSFYIFEEAFSFYNFGSASAISFILFAIIFVLSIGQIKFNNKNV